ncbi:MAG: CRISPR-associated endonuclease Cas1 [Thiomonas sp.]|uniref:CRISPR-associated endonuclease Cas1 n=1 Tax=Thiomonas sp. TaxID=2047785 RepID=UPI002A35B778|nr:CRISPR-associated endonuclease Cas1 [Thiomonas sp.]MDY0331716.1 CRISPR-associated endonuclease Cas1 [Thiomonas sp.]
MDLATPLPLLDRALLDDSLLAGWERVRDNAGGPGVDGVTITQFGRDILTRLPALRQRVTSGSYAAQPLRRIELTRPGKSPRVLAVPCVADRVVQSAVALTLSPLLDPGFEDFSFGYRPGRNVPRAVQRLCDARDAGLVWIAEADIQSCFDGIPWAALMQRLSDTLPDPSLLPFIRHWLGLPLQWGNGRQKPRAMGVPQGSPLSPLLSNVFLDGLDKALAGGPWRAVRYADDFVLAAARREDAQQGLKRAAAWLKSAELRLNLDKTRVVHVDQGFTFLGVQFLGRQVSAVQPGAEPWVLPRPDKARPGPKAAHQAPNQAPKHALPNKKNKRSAEGKAPVSDRTSTSANEGAQSNRTEAPSPRAPKPAATPQAAAQVVAAQAAAVAPPTHSAAPRLRTLYLTEPGAYLHIDGERLLVGKGQDELASIPAEKVDQVVADTEGAVSFGALRLLLRHDATLLLTPGASGEPAGLLVPMNGRQVQLRAAQFARLSDGGFRIAVAQRIVQAKIANSRVLLRRYRRFRPEGDRNEDAKLQRLYAQCTQATTLDAVRGFEGSAARVHFDAFATLLGPQWGFDHRNRQPPKDPVNALLSYGYTLLFHTVHTFILRRGLDPFVGALHAPRDGHAALASDLMEPYRSLIVDATVLRFLTQGGVDPEDFAQEEPGRLPVGVKRRFIQALEQKLASPVGRDGSAGDAPDWRRIIERDVNGWAAAVQGQPQAYAPWQAR